MDINSTFKDTLVSFDTLTLKELETRARLMKRKESKFLIKKEGLDLFLKKLLKSGKYDALMINEQRVFEYDNMYMDYKNLMFYNDHEENKEKRMKVRKRLYKSTGETFFECKFRDGAFMDKKRVELKNDAFETLDEKDHQFFATTYGVTDLRLLPTMQTTYQRITLCSKNAKERITIDYDLVFNDPRNAEAGSYKTNNFVIIEVKQDILSDDTSTKKAIEKSGGVLAKGCSKYCLGLIYFDRVEKYSHFQNTVDYINQHGGITHIARETNSHTEQHHPTTTPSTEVVATT